MRLLAAIRRGRSLDDFSPRCLRCSRINGDRETGVRELGRKDGKILLAGDGNVCSIDATADVHILSEGGRLLGKWLKILLPDQRNVAPINPTARIDVTNENAHANSDVAGVGAVVDAEQVDGDRLSVTHVGEIHSDLSAVNNWRARNGGGSTAPWSYGGTGNRNWSSKGDDNLMVAARPAAAAFNAGIAGERQIDVEGAGCPMCLSRQRSLVSADSPCNAP